jgi:hypothetical protein
MVERVTGNAHLVAIAAPMILLAGCAVANTMNFFDGPSPPDDQIAVLEGHGHEGMQAVYVSSVDGKRASTFWVPHRVAISAKLPPGEHLVTLSLESGPIPGSARKPCRFEANFEAGHHYKITRWSRSPGQTAFVWWSAELHMETMYRGVVTKQVLGCH